MGLQGYQYPLVDLAPHTDLDFDTNNTQKIDR